MNYVDPASRNQILEESAKVAEGHDHELARGIARQLRDLKRFPIQKGITRTIPWSMILPHADHAEANHYQTLTRLGERGGLSPEEALAVLDGFSWFDRTWKDRPLVKDEIGRCATELERRRVEYEGATGSSE